MTDRWVFLALLLAGGSIACASGKDGSTGEFSAGATTESASGGSDATSASTAGTEASDGAQADCLAVDWDVLVATCRAATDEMGCAPASSDVEALASRFGGPCYVCVWEDWVPTTIDEAGACVFGEVVASCELDALGPGGIGCLSAPAECTGGQKMIFREGTDGVEILVAPLCSFPPDVDACFAHPEGEPMAPECACGCDPSFPGI